MRQTAALWSEISVLGANNGFNSGFGVLKWQNHHLRVQWRLAHFRAADSFECEQTHN